MDPLSRSITDIEIINKSKKIIVKPRIVRGFIIGISGRRHEILKSWRILIGTKKIYTCHKKKEMKYLNITAFIVLLSFLSCKKDITTCYYKSKMFITNFILRCDGIVVVRL